MKCQGDLGGRGENKTSLSSRIIETLAEEYAGDETSLEKRREFRIIRIINPA